MEGVFDPSNVPLIVPSQSEKADPVNVMPFPLKAYVRAQVSEIVVAGGAGIRRLLDGQLRLLGLADAW